MILLQHRSVYRSLTNAQSTRHSLVRLFSMLLSQARQQLLPLLSNTVLQANASASFLRARTATVASKCCTTASTKAAAAIAGAPWSSSNSSSRHQHSSAHTTSSGMAETAAAPVEGYDTRWVDQWNQGVAPGQLWDAGKVSPYLGQLLGSKQLNVEGKRVLVPGCGRGYDVFAFALAGASPAVGLDLSEKAVAAAAAERDSQLAHDPAAAARAEVAAANFFEFEHSSGQLFDLGFDYTFLCALHPDMRKDWAAGWARLLAPGAELATIIFPVGPGPAAAPANPPWQVSNELYQELLLPAGFEQLELQQIPQELSHKGRAGREWFARWRRLGSSGSSGARGANAAAVDASTHSCNVAASRM